MIDLHHIPVNVISLKYLEGIFEFVRAEAELTRCDCDLFNTPFYSLRHN